MVMINNIIDCVELFSLVYPDLIKFPRRTVYPEPQHSNTSPIILPIN